MKLQLWSFKLWSSSCQFQLWFTVDKQQLRPNIEQIPQPDPLVDLLYPDPQTTDAPNTWAGQYTLAIPPAIYGGNMNGHINWTETSLFTVEIYAFCCMEKLIWEPWKSLESMELCLELMKHLMEQLYIWVYGTLCGTHKANLLQN